ncbi:hypothetical protein P4O66_002825 [Electrophorus voltai]|uniref:Fibronectin type-III domain-containing protein n=1 Tax=Electrophorus voltai TaxID=2609070 RepID=A0AAD9DNH0_9TELE|nr:hypothetical protein P4O66_002825 [Electrophorus voltai]
MLCSCLSFVILLCTCNNKSLCEKQCSATEDWGVAFNVTMNSNDSFNLSWNSSLSEKYHCYLVEWWEMGEKPKYMSFYQKKSYHEVRTENALFQPYKRYHFLLHVRPYKDTCNLKDANNSEHTYGRTQAYLLEGTPSAAPGNVSIYNITHSSFVITWNPVSEVDLRGFLQGYIIRYINVPDQSGKHVTVEPNVSSYKLLNLKSRTMYSVQLSAYTAAGEGLSNEPLHIDTKPPVTESTDDTLRGEPTEPHAASTITDSTANEVFPIDGNTEGSALTPPTDAINTMNTSNTRGTDDVLTVKPNVPILTKC